MARQVAAPTKAGALPVAPSIEARGPKRRLCAVLRVTRLPTRATVRVLAAHAELVGPATTAQPVLEAGAGPGNTVPVEVPAAAEATTGISNERPVGQEGNIRGLPPPTGPQEPPWWQRG